MNIGIFINFLLNCGRVEDTEIVVTKVATVAGKVAAVVIRVATVITKVASVAGKKAAVVIEVATVAGKVATVVSKVATVATLLVTMQGNFVKKENLVEEIKCKKRRGALPVNCRAANLSVGRSRWVRRRHVPRPARSIDGPD